MARLDWLLGKRSAIVCQAVRFEYFRFALQNKIIFKNPGIWEFSVNNLELCHTEKIQIGEFVKVEPRRGAADCINMLKEKDKFMLNFWIDLFFICSFWKPCSNSNQVLCYCCSAHSKCGKNISFCIVTDLSFFSDIFCQNILFTARTYLPR